jgi:hypothetical protein
MATYDYIRRANENTRDEMENYVAECNELWLEADNERHSLVRSGWSYETHWAMRIEYLEENSEGEVSFYQCSNCKTVLTDGETEESQCPSCWQEWEY